MIQITLFQENNTEEYSQQNVESDPLETREANWQEASNVKNKRAIKDVGLNQKNFQVMERKLTFIKKLRKYKKITEKEYQARKQRLLDQL